MTILIFAAGLGLAALVGHGMGVRRERARHARYAELTHRGPDAPRDGVRLKRVRVSR